MSKNNKGRNGGNRATPNHSTDRDYINPDPVAGWHDLAKPARLNRKAKRTWRRKAGGAVQGEVLALLILATVAGLLLAVGAS